MELTSIDTFRYTNPYPEEIPADGTYKVYNNESELDIKTLLTAPSRPVFVFPKRIWDEVQYITKQSPNSEFALFLITKQFTQLAPKYMAIDLYFPKQEAGHSGVSIANEDCTEFYELLSTHEAYKEHMHCRIAHLHSHNSMGVFWSGADTNQQLSKDDFGFFDDFRFYLVVNTHDQVRCSYVVYKPLLRRMDNIPVVVIGTEDTLTDERKAELDAYLKERVTPLVTNVFADIKTFDGYETELPPPPAPKPAPRQLPLFTYERTTGFRPESKRYTWEPDSTTHYWEENDYNFATDDLDYIEAAKKVVTYCRRAYSGEEYAPDELEQLRNDIFRYDIDGFLTDMVENDRDLMAVADVFDGDITAAVDACNWLAEHQAVKHIYFELLLSDINEEN